MIIIDRMALGDKNEFLLFIHFIGNCGLLKARKILIKKFVGIFSCSEVTSCCCPVYWCIILSSFPALVVVEIPAFWLLW